MFKINNSKTSSLIRLEFLKFFEMRSGCNDLYKIDSKILRSLMIDFFREPSFLKLYREYFIEILESNNLSRDDYCLQNQPTPRVFEPNAHGTSLHCDYWYGHGEETFTIWTSITEVVPENAFSVSEESSNAELHRLFYNSHSIDSKIMEYFDNHSYPVLPSADQYALFDSKLMHASNINHSPLRRVSFDFRIAKKSDPSCTKELQNYFVLSENSTLEKNVRHSALKCLKYVCGGLHKSTSLQHIIIENFAELNGLNIVAQEAEIERFGHPMLKQYLSGLLKEKGIDLVLIASESVIDLNFRDFVSCSFVDVIFCLEKKNNKFNY
jgi:hypothetical protein